MIVNSSATIYHKSIDNETRLEKWERFNYSKVWFYKRKSASVNEGYDNANSCEVRIPLEHNPNLQIGNFSIGDIVVEGTLINDITSQQDLSSYQIFNITSISDNNFGTQPHIHIGGR